MAGLSILVSLSSLYLSSLSVAAFSQFESSVHMVHSLREIKSAIPADYETSGQADLLAIVNKTETASNLAYRRALNLVDNLLRLRNSSFLIALTLSIVAFFGKPRSAGWTSMILGLCTVAFCCKWI